MRDQRLTILKRQVTPDWLILDFCGSITSEFDQNLDNLLQELRSTSYKNIAFNLTEVTLMDGAGLQQLLIFCVFLRRLSRKLSAFGLNDDIRQVFQFTRMDAIFNICQDELQMIEQSVT